MSARIDAHQHYWLLRRGDYGWLTPEAGLLFEDYLPRRGIPELKANGIRGSVVVQAAPSIAETKYLLGLAVTEPSIVGVVGWMDLKDETFAEQLDELAANPLFVGIRPNWPRDEAGRLLQSDTLRRSLRLLAERNIPVDLLLSSFELPDAIRILEAAPGLRIIIDHIGNPTYREDELTAWRQAICDIARYPEAYCKVSGMITCVPKGREVVTAIRPYFDYIFSVFGASRLLFGSDWPVCRLAGEYRDTVSTLEALTSGLPKEEREAIFGGNAVRFYGLKL